MMLFDGWWNMKQKLIQDYIISLLALLKRRRVATYALKSFTTFIITKLTNTNDIIDAPIEPSIDA